MDIHVILPDDLFSDSAITNGRFKEEYLAWTTFVQAWRSFERLAEIVRSEIEIDTTGGERRSRWTRKYSDALEECWEKTNEVLTTDWPVEIDGKLPLNRIP